MQELKVNELNPHPKNDYFFDDMNGEKWSEFLESIKTSGVIEPIIITQDKTIVSGHQRIRACKELGIQTVWCEMRDYKNDDAVIKDLLETNIRQRGDVGGSMRKQGLRNKELERLYGVRNGSANEKGKNQYIGEPNNSADQITQQDLAKQNNQSVDTWNNAKKLAEATPELDEFIKTGIITTTTAVAIAKKLSQTEQEELLSSLPHFQKLTQKQVQEYVDKLKEKDNIIDGYEMKLKSASSEQTKKHQEQLENLKTQIGIKDKKISTYENQKEMLEKKAALNNEEAEKYKKLKSDIEFLSKQKNDISRQITSATELAGLTVSLQSLLEKDLAPIKFKRCMEVLNTSDIAVQNLNSVLNSLNNWISEINQYLPNANVITIEQYNEI